MTCASMLEEDKLSIGPFTFAESMMQIGASLTVFYRRSKQSMNRIF